MCAVNSHVWYTMRLHTAITKVRGKRWCIVFHTILFFITFNFELNPVIMVSFLTLNLITAAVAVGNVVADPAGARAAASLQGGRGESNTQSKWLFGQEKRPFEGDAPLFATTVRASPHDAEALVLNARVAHGHATAAREQARHRDECKLR